MPLQLIKKTSWGEILPVWLIFPSAMMWVCIHKLFGVGWELPSFAGSPVTGIRTEDTHPHPRFGFGFPQLPSYLSWSQRMMEVTRTLHIIQSPVPTFYVRSPESSADANKRTTTKNDSVPSTLEVTTHGQTIHLLTFFIKTVIPSWDLWRTLPGQNISPVTVFIITTVRPEAMVQRMQQACLDRSSCLRASRFTKGTGKCQMSSSRFRSYPLHLWPPWIILAI